MTTVENPLEFGQPELEVKKPETDDLRFHSVTTILKVISNPAFEYVACEKVANDAIKKRDSWTAIEQSDGTDEARRWLIAARFRTPQDELSPMDFGTAMHKIAEEYTLTGVKPVIDPDLFKNDAPLAQRCLDHFADWLNRFQPEFIAAEVTVYSPTYGYAGTADQFAKINRVPLISDYKFSKRGFDRQGKVSPIYSETALQLAGYRFAEMAAVWRPRKFESFKRRYYLLSQQERDQAVPVPPVDGGLGIKITPDHCIAYPVRCDEAVHEAFLFAMEVFRWQQDLAKNVIGEPLTVED